MKDLKIPSWIIILSFMASPPVGILFFILRIIHESDKAGADIQMKANRSNKSNIAKNDGSTQHTVYHSSYGGSHTGYKTGGTNQTQQPFSNVNPNPSNTTYHYSYVKKESKENSSTISPNGAQNTFGGAANGTVKSTFTPPPYIDPKTVENSFNGGKRYKSSTGTVLSTIFMWISLFITIMMFFTSIAQVADPEIGFSVSAVIPTMVTSSITAVLYLFRQYFKSRDYRIISYLSMIRGERFISIEKLANVVDASKARVMKDLQHMITKGLLGPEAIINKRIRYLILCTDAIEEAEEDFNRKKNPMDFAPEHIKSKEEIAEDISEHEKILHRIRELNDDIDNREVSDKIDRIEELTRKIFKYIEENPRLEPQIQTFLNYYLPTTLKLLNSYAFFEEQGVKGDNISTGMKNIEDTLDMLVEGYENQLDKLFESDTLDVTTDINVLEQMMKADGISSESDFVTDTQETFTSQRSEPQYRNTQPEFTDDLGFGGGAAAAEKKIDSDEK